jgi:hypothetical protein
MEWLNLHTSQLDSPTVVGAEPIDRATWLFLLRYCCGQENGGVIEGAGAWGDRKWQQLARVTLAEVRRDSELWAWEGENLRVMLYPNERENLLKNKREAGRAGGTKKTEAKTQAAQTNGALGGRPAQSLTKPNPSTNQSTTQAETQGKSKSKSKGKSKGKSNTKETAPAVAGSHNAGEVCLGLGDDIWLAGLAKSYPHADVPTELVKMNRWCEVNRRQPTRRRFVNWLNRCDAPLNGSAPDRRQLESDQTIDELRTRHGGTF